MTNVRPNQQERKSEKLVQTPQALTTVYTDLGVAKEMGNCNIVGLIFTISGSGSAGITAKPQIQSGEGGEFRDMCLADGTIIEFSLDIETNAMRVFNTLNLAEKIKIQVKAGNTGSSINANFIKVWSS